MERSEMTGQCELVGGLRLPQNFSRFRSFLFLPFPQLTGQAGHFCFGPAAAAAERRAFWRNDACIFLGCQRRAEFSFSQGNRTDGPSADAKHFRDFPLRKLPFLQQEQDFENHLRLKHEFV